MSRKRVTKIQSVGCTWEQALKEFILWKQAQAVSDTTLNDYESHVSRFFQRYDCWQKPSFREYVHEYMSDKIKPATYNLRLIYLRAFFKWCMDEGEGYLTVNPLAEFKRKKAEPRIVDVPEDRLQKLLTLPDHNTFAGLRDYSLICLTLDTGIRPKEAFQLTIQDIDLQQMQVHVLAHVSKTRTARSMDISPSTAESIRKIIKVRADWWDNDVPVFCTNEGTELSRHTWGDRLEAYSKTLGFKIRPYDLRHCFALWFLRNGGNAFGFAKYVGAYGYKHD
jgi:site-specific recombinase XerD